MEWLKKGGAGLSLIRKLCPHSSYIHEETEEMHDTTYIGNKHSCNKRAIYPQRLQKLWTKTVCVSPLLSSTAYSSGQCWSKWRGWVPFASGFISNSAATSTATAATTTASNTTTCPTTTFLWSAISVTLYVEVLKREEQQIFTALKWWLHYVLYITLLYTKTWNSKFPGNNKEVNELSNMKYALPSASFCFICFSLMKYITRRNRFTT